MNTLPSAFRSSQHDVAGLEVPVDDARVVCERESAAQRQEPLQRAFERVRVLFAHGVEMESAAWEGIFKSFKLMIFTRFYLCEITCFKYCFVYKVIITFAAFALDFV